MQVSVRHLNGFMVSPSAKHVDMIDSPITIGFHVNVIQKGIGAVDLREKIDNGVRNMRSANHPVECFDVAELLGSLIANRRSIVRT